MAKYQEWLSPEGLQRIEGWAQSGLTDDQIAHNIGISRSTLNEWKYRFPDISDTIKRGKKCIDEQVENALFKKAIGSTYTRLTRERLVDTGQKKRHKDTLHELTENEWQFAIRYFGFRCAYCGASLKKPTKDHIRPLHDGGMLTRENIIPVCIHCNSSRQDKEMLSWFQAQPFYSKERAQKISDYVTFVLSLDDILDKQIGQLVETKEVIEEIPPDTSACIFWLKNRMPERWRDHPSTENKEVFGRLDEILKGMRDAAYEA